VPARNGGSSVPSSSICRALTTLLKITSPSATDNGCRWMLTGRSSARTRARNPDRDLGARFCGCDRRRRSAERRERTSSTNSCQTDETYGTTKRSWASRSQTSVARVIGQDFPVSGQWRRAEFERRPRHARPRCAGAPATAIGAGHGPVPMYYRRSDRLRAFVGCPRSDGSFSGAAPAPELGRWPSLRHELDRRRLASGHATSRG
jgi:hypothetical protein